MHFVGEAMACGLLMGSGLKGEETLQISLVGTSGIKNVMVITDGTLKVKGHILFYYTASCLWCNV